MIRWSFMWPTSDQWNDAAITGLVGQEMPFEAFGEKMQCRVVEAKRHSWLVAGPALWLTVEQVEDGTK